MSGLELGGPVPGDHTIDLVVPPAIEGLLIPRDSNLLREWNNARIVDMRPIGGEYAPSDGGVSFAGDGGGHRNKVYEVLFDNGKRAVFKPKSGESAGLKATVPAGSYWRREGAFYVLDRVFGFGLVPLTLEACIDGDVGSLQDWVTAPQRWLSAYDPMDVQRMAALDYAGGMLDRTGNWMTQADGRPAANDNGLSLPVARDIIMSPFVVVTQSKPLANPVMDEIVHADPITLESGLLAYGIEDAAISRTRNRLAVLRQGRLEYVA